MNTHADSRIGVLGLGNLMRTDDAVGMLAVRELAQSNLVPSSIHLIEGGTMGLDLLADLHGLTHILALDAVDAEVVPGTLLRFEGPDLGRLPTSKSVHLLGFADLINVLHLMNAPPDKILLLGVQPASTDWGTTLTPPVQAAQAELVRAALLQLSEWLESAPPANLDCIGEFLQVPAAANSGDPPGRR